MENLGQKRPKVIDENPELGYPSFRCEMYESSNIYNANSRPKVTRTVDVINASSTTLTVMHSDGFMFNIGHTQQHFHDEAIIIVNYEVSGGALIPWTAISRNMPKRDLDFLNKVRALYEQENRQALHSAITIRLYYTVDVSDIGFRPNGIYIKPVDVQLVAACNSDVAVPFRRQAQVGTSSFDDDIGVTQAAVCMAVYVVHNPEDRERLFINSATGLVILDPLYTLHMPEGLHRINVNGVKLPGDTRTSELEHIPISDFRKNNFFRGLDDFTNNFDRDTKQTSKADQDKIFKRMNEYLDRNIVPLEMEARKEQLIDIPCFFGHSLKEVVAALEQVGKLKTNLEKLVS